MNGNTVKARRSPARNVAFQLWSVYKHVLLWFWIVFTAIYVTINELVMRGIIPNEAIRDTGSIWSGASFSPRIFLLVLGILLTLGSFTSFISNGITRRSFYKGGLTFVAAMSLICAAVNLLGYPIERYVIELSGAERVLKHPNLIVDGLTNLIMYFAYFCFGWLIGTGFYRFHWFKGILVCWLSVALMVGMEILLNTELANGATADSVLKLPILAVVSALIVWLNYVYLRKVAVKRKITL